MKLNLFVLAFFAAAFLLSGCQKLPDQWYLAGEKAEKDNNLGDAKNAYQKACDGKFVPGCVKLGEIAHNQNDKPTAMAAFQRACELGMPRGCLYVGNFEGDDLKSKAWLLKACEGQEFEACYLLGRKEQKDKNIDKAIEYLGQACRKWEAKACLHAGSIEQKRNNIKEAKSWYKIGCEKGHNQMCIVLGTLEEDPAKAGEYFKIACDKKEWEGCRRLAQIHREQGNNEQAKLYYDRACKNNDAPSCDELKKIK